MTTPELKNAADNCAIMWRTAALCQSVVTNFLIGGQAVELGSCTNLKHNIDCTAPAALKENESKDDAVFEYL
jgi:hypothetical protein